MLSMSPSRAQTPKPANAPAPRSANDVTIRGTIIALRNADATQFSAKQDLSGKPADALKALEALVAQRKATSVANPAVTSKSGQRAVSDSGKITLEVLSVVSPDGKTADINLALDDNGHKIVTSFQVSNGDVKFLGSVQSPTDKTMTAYVFVRVSY